MTNLWQILGAILGGGVISTVAQALFNYWTKNREMDISAQNFYLQNLEARMAAQDAKAQKCEEQRAELYREIASLRSIITNLKDTISRIERKQLNATITCNERGFIEEWSPGATALLYYTHDEIVGRHLNMLIPNRFRDQHAQMFATAVAENRAPQDVGPRNLLIVDRNGREIPVVLSLSGRNKDGHWHYTADIHLGDTDEEVTCDATDGRV